MWCEQAGHGQEASHESEQPVRNVGPYKESTAQRCIQFYELVAENANLTMFQPIFTH